MNPRNFFVALCGFAAAATGMSSAASAQNTASSFSGTNSSGAYLHYTPNAQTLSAHKAAGMSNLSGPLTYHGGQVMLPYVAVYPIFWAPSKLQSGASTGYSSAYGTVHVLLAAWMPGHGLMSIATQYYQTISGTTTYINNGGGLSGYVVDSAAYPTSQCASSAGTNCIIDSQIQAKITSVMNSQGWSGGLSKIYVLYTSSGENTCTDNTGTSCSSSVYCAYHSSFTLNGQSVIYAIAPYGQPTNGCSAGSAPNDSFADSAASYVSHEIMEAVTDPFGTAWYDASGNEIGDLCNQNFGTNTWALNSATGNQFWNGFLFELQQQWNNHTGGCSQVGP